MTLQTEILVIGSGAAGLSLALTIADRFQVKIISKENAAAGSTAMAQGGIAAALRAGDSVESHIQDTLEAGAGLCNPKTVSRVIEKGPAAIDFLIAQGVKFTGGSEPEEGSGFHLTREGGHSRRRVLHVDDATGRAVHQALLHNAHKHPNIVMTENALAVDLITNRQSVSNGKGKDQCEGAYVMEIESGKIDAMTAKATVLATGGASKVYLYTSNPDGSTGDGIAMAWRAGCRVANMEFNQFHPTCLYHPEAKSFLLSEALRGEGAHLTLPNGERFMHKFDERAELAPRDVVARAIDHEMKRLGLDNVYLDISHRDPDFIIGHFPNIYRRCKEFGFDLTTGPIPVVPAAHYTCGGVVTDLTGKTDIDRLYAIGEVACTGLHGANRMASNSLLECLVFGMAAGEDILARGNELPLPGSAAPWDESRVTDSDEEIVVSHNWHELRRFMWNYVGIVRTNKRLERAKRRTDMLLGEIQEFYGNFRVTPDLLELRNLATVGDLIVRSALERRESRGLHYTTDYPGQEANPTDTILTP